MDEKHVETVETVETVGNIKRFMEAVNEPQTLDEYLGLERIPSNEKYLGWVLILEDYYVFNKGSKQKIIGYIKQNCGFKGCSGCVIFEGLNDMYCMSFDQIRCYAKCVDKKNKKRMIRVE